MNREMSVTDRKFAARDMLMIGLQLAIANCGDVEVMQPRMVEEFRRIEKFLGFEPGSWSPYP